MVEAGRFAGLVPADATLALSGVCKAYGRIPVLYPVSLRLGAGEALAVLGANGSGKTTLLRLIAGVERPSAGSIDCRPTEPGSMAIGFAGHDSYLYEDLTGFENLRFADTLAGYKTPEVDIAATLDAVGMRTAANNRVRTYSAGMKRRIGLARLLLFQPRIILLDEPHASLDKHGQELVDSLVCDARATGRIVVIVSHDPDRAVDLCSHVLCLDTGRTTFVGESEVWTRGARLRLVDRAAP